MSLALGTAQSPSRLLSQSALDEPTYEGLPISWGTFSQTFCPPGDLQDHTACGSGTDHDQEMSQQLIEQESEDSAPHLLLLPDDSKLSPAAMFLAAFSPVTTTTRLPDDEGETVAGYVLGSVIAHGGFSTIRRASSPSGGTVAIKIVKRSDISKQSNPSLARRRLDHETEIWSSLSHEHILPLFSVEHTPYADFFVTLLCPAGSLFDILKREGTPALPHDDAGMMFRQVVRGVRYLHEVAGYVHRDIKLENVLVDEMGVCRICDFGLARKIGETDDDEISHDGEDPLGVQRHRSTISHARRQPKGSLPSHLSILRNHGPRRHRTSTPFGDHSPAPVHPAHVFQPGSLPYAAPELLSPQVSTKHHGADQAQDMWALGVLLYALLTGRLPFADAFEPRLTMKILHGVFDMPSGLGRGADRVLRGCLERSVCDRWTIAMVDEMAWDIGWGEVDETSSVTHEDEFDVVDHPSHPSPSSRSKSRSRVRRSNDSALDLAPLCSKRSLSRASAATTSSISTRSTSRSISRPPPIACLPLSPRFEEHPHSVLSPSTSISSAQLEGGGSAFVNSPRSPFERGRRPKKADAVPTHRFALSSTASTGRSEISREGDLYAGASSNDTALLLNTVTEPSLLLNDTSSTAGEKLHVMQEQMECRSSKRAESTPPASSAWPSRRSGPSIEEDRASCTPLRSRGSGGAFLREPSATPIPIARQSGTRSRSVGCETDSSNRRSCDPRPGFDLPVSSVRASSRLSVLYV
ncbi:kinase-like domain-containing protein [Phlebopus sp. FC_14]|nr:kinase-like domain-containing protein [Phlebopus sp. FC_14]